MTKPKGVTALCENWILHDLSNPHGVSIEQCVNAAHVDLGDGTMCLECFVFMCQDNENVLTAKLHYGFGETL